MDASLIAQIANGHLHDARVRILERLDLIREQYRVRLKAMIGDSLREQDETLTEADVMKSGRIKVIRRRIRKGKLQRNIRKAAIKGFMIKKGKVTRIPAAQRLRMRLKARRAVIKRRAKLQQSLRKRKMSLRKRKAMGIH